jgi:UDP-glucose 4-epimerase
VTGGAGFIGSHLSDRLLREGAKVRILDNFYTGDIKNLNSIINDVDLIDGDIRDKDIVNKAMIGVDIVFHEAAQINPVKAVEDPMYDFEVNAIGTLNLLFEAHKKNVKKFIMASTNVYGNARVLKMKEDYSTLYKKDSLLSPYAAAKASAEAYLKVANDELKLPTVRLRYTNVFGPRQLSKSESGVIAIFVKAALNEQPLKIFGDGTHSRDFVFISDVIEANILAALKEEANGDVFNVGTGEETLIKELAEMVRTQTGTNVPIKYVESRASDFVRVNADLNHIQKKLGFLPKVKFADGLKIYIEWCKNNLSRL